MMSPMRSIDEQLRAAGFDDEAASSRAAMFDTVVAAHAQMAGVRPAAAWFVPGRIEVFGKHTDYAGGRSLVAAVPRGFAIVASPREDGRVRALDARWRERVELDPAEESVRFHGWANYVAVVARRFARNFPGAALGADLSFSSDLPRAAGVSSSSALVVGVGSAVADRGRLYERPEWTEAIRTPLDLAGYLGAVENGLTFGSLAGTSGVGTHGGSEDHTAILTCRAGRVHAYAYVPVRPQGDATMPDDWRFVVMTSGVHADKAGTAKDRYNRASLATRALLAVWRGLGADAPTLAAALDSGPGALETLRAAIGDGRDGFSGDDLRRRLAHFVDEDARVPRALAAFAAGDRDALGELSAATQRDAEMMLGNQIPETVRLAAAARDCGAFASSSFGAGFGGSVWALVPADRAGAFAESWRSAYAGAYPQHHHIESFATRPAPGVTRLDISV